LGFSFYGLALVVPVYTLSVLRGALRLYIKFSYKKKSSRLIMLEGPSLL